MRSQWEEATRYFENNPVATPYLTSFYTLPRQWRFVDEVRQMQAASNVLPDGDFETAPDQPLQAWTEQEAPTLDDVLTVARRVADEPHDGRQCLMLRI